MEKEDIEPEEIPEGLKDEIKKPGAVMVALRQVRQSIGKDRQGWQLALANELQSLRDSGATEAVKHVPRNKQILRMKVVLTLESVPGLLTKKKKARVCVWKFSTEETHRFVLYDKHGRKQYSSGSG